MSKKVFVVDANSSVLEAAKLMTKYKTSCLITMNKTKPAGIITENDITKFASSNKNSEQEKISSILSSPIVIAEGDNSFFEVLSLMKKKKLKRIPIVKKNMIVGIITETEIIKGIVYINQILNKTLREGYITPDQHKKGEEEILRHVLEEGLRREPPWVKKEIDLLRRIYEEQEEVIKKISKSTRKYSLTEWRMNIWTECKYKKEKMKNNEIIYMCDKLNGFCVYKNCPLNKG
ncbi:CBS domain-containing protein [Candidatus Woesearchaeota archaeon]|nr:CBS domain-containing protein [Candidatus Woesearchaeota archaeon]